MYCLVKIYFMYIHICMYINIHVYILTRNMEDSKIFFISFWCSLTYVHIYIIPLNNIISLNNFEQNFIYEIFVS